MKKIISLVLLLALTLSLCACGSSNTAETEPAAYTGLQMGYARESYMPEGKVNLSGAGNNVHRVSVGYMDYLYATCIAISEGDNTILLFSTDALSVNKDWNKEIRQLISEETGVPENNIQVSATHTHSGPTIGGTLPLTVAWKPTYVNALVTSAKNAIADLAPATLYGAKVQTEGMAFVRHYKMEDGSYAGSNFGDFSKKIVDHATIPDEEMILIKAEREGDKKDIMLMNFQAHPCFSGGTNYNDLSSDYIHNVRETFEKETGMHFIYFLGASGNQNTNSQISSENKEQNRTREAYGAALAKYAIDAIPTMEKIEGSGVKTTQKQIEYKCNDYGQDRLEDAQKVTKMYNETGDSTKCTQYAKTMGFQSVFECNGIVNCSRYPETDMIELNTCSFGGVGFVAAPNEMFSNTGMYLKENSPFNFTIISSITNGYNNYFPTKEAFEYGCYESFTARFAIGVAEDTAAELVNMLKEVQ